MTHEDLVVLTAWMAENDYSAADIAYAVEKAGTDKYADELAQAKAALKAEAEIESQGVIWDDPTSPAAKRSTEELKTLRKTLAADREAGYPSERGAGLSDTARAPQLRLLRGQA